MFYLIIIHMFEFRARKKMIQGRIANISGQWYSPFKDSCETKERRYIDIYI